MPDCYKIGEVVEKLHINKETIRYYERIGLISNPSREKNGYRLYSEEEFNKLWFILTMKKFGFSLKEIKTLMDTLYQDIIGGTVKTIELIINGKIDEINSKICDLENTKRLLQKVNNNLKSQNMKCYNDFESFQENNP